MAFCYIVNENPQRVVPRYDPLSLVENEMSYNMIFHVWAIQPEIKYS